MKSCGDFHQIVTMQLVIYIRKNYYHYLLMCHMQVSAQCETHSNWISKFIVVKAIVFKTSETVRMDAWLCKSYELLSA